MWTMSVEEKNDFFWPIHSSEEASAHLFGGESQGSSNSILRGVKERPKEQLAGDEREERRDRGPLSEGTAR